MDQLGQITLAQLQSALNLVTKNATGTPNVTEIYADGGLFGICSAEGSLVNAMVNAYGFESKLRWVGSKFDNPIFEALTYVGTSNFDQATGCGSCNRPEYAVCRQTSCFGRICAGTGEVQFDQLGLYANTGIKPRVMFGNVTDPSGNVLLAAGSTLESAWQIQVFSAAYNLRNRVHYEMWNGTGAVVGGHTQMTSFPTLINTGHIDALDVNAAPCTALDSTILNFANNVLGAANSPNITLWVATLVRRIKERISGMGLAPDSATMYLVMSPHIKDCFFDAYACGYGQICQSNFITNNDALAVARNRDEWAGGLYVPVDGSRIPVVIDNQMPYSQRSVGTNSYDCSDIYLITTELPGGPNGGVITYGEFQDFNVTGADIIAWLRQQFGGAPFNVTDGGRYVVTYTLSGGLCLDAKVLVKPRIVVRMPQLAGRITNVCCAPTGGSHPVDPNSFPEGLYHVGGGVYSTPVSSLYGPCAQQTGSYGTGRGQ